MLEHILYHCITEHLNTYQILSDRQYGFRPHHSCDAQLLSVVEEMQLAMDHHYSVDLIFIDFRKTFDKVLHQGHSSSYDYVDSGVPQGTVLGPSMVLLYINDITANKYFFWHQIIFR